MSLRIFAAIAAVLFGTTATLAQSDPSVRENLLAAARAKDDTQDKQKDKATDAKGNSDKKAGKRKPKAKPADTAEKKTGDDKAKAEPESKPEKKAANPKPESKSAAKPDADADDKQEPAAARKKSKSAGKKNDKKNGDDKSSTTGSASTASPEVKASLREAFAALPPAERTAVQSDLIWTGDYNGLIDGQFSDRLADAVMAYQKRQKAKPTGMLTAAERAALTAAVRPKQDEVGWRVVEDPVIGARVGLPGKIATETTRGPNGTRWSSAQGQLQIETFRIDTGATLDAVFEQEKKQPRRRITYNVLRPDFFVVSGMHGLKKLYVRAFAKDGEVRGVRILYDQAMEGTMDPIVVAMSSAFVPFAGYAASNSAEGPRRKVEYGTGVVVSATGHIVTARHVIEGCNVIAVPRLGHAERVAEDKESGLALLRVYGMRGLSPITLHNAAPDSDGVTLVGIADPQAQAGGDAISTAPARLNANTLDSAPVPGFSGAATLDSQGRFLGIAVQRSPMLAGVAANQPPAALVPVARIRAFLDANYVAPAAGRPGLDGARDATVRVVCVRK